MREQIICKRYDSAAVPNQNGLVAFFSVEYPLAQFGSSLSPKVYLAAVSAACLPEMQSIAFSTGNLPLFETRSPHRVVACVLLSAWHVVWNGGESLQYPAGHREIDGQSSVLCGSILKQRSSLGLPAAQYPDISLALIQILVCRPLPRG